MAGLSKQDYGKSIARAYAESGYIAMVPVFDNSVSGQNAIAAAAAYSGTFYFALITGIVGSLLSAFDRLFDLGESEIGLCGISSGAISALICLNACPSISFGHLAGCPADIEKDVIRRRTSTANASEIYFLVPFQMWQRFSVKKMIYQASIRPLLIEVGLFDLITGRLGRKSIESSDNGTGFHPNGEGCFHYHSGGHEFSGILAIEKISEMLGDKRCE